MKTATCGLHCTDISFLVHYAAHYVPDARTPVYWLMTIFGRDFVVQYLSGTTQSSRGMELFQGIRNSPGLMSNERDESSGNLTSARTGSNR
jgi:hypothetical protein